MGTINTNKLATKHCVIFYKHQGETPLDVCQKFRNWTKEKNIKSYVEIAEMLDITPNEVKKYLDLAKMPEYDSAVLKRMKEIMAQNRF